MDDIKIRLTTYIRKHPGIYQRDLLRPPQFRPQDRPSLDALVDEGAVTRQMNADGSTLYVRGAEPVPKQPRKRRRTATEKAAEVQAIRDLPQTIQELKARLEALELTVEALTSLGTK